MLIGAPLAMRSTRGAAVGIGTSFMVVMFYYAMVSVCLALGKGGLLPPAFAAWFANLFFALVGVYLIKNTA
jgi:lipopolysaccharide export LptBFGC system permease protein LptF